MELETRYIKTNGVTLHVKLAGDPDGKPLLFLHGFPDFWYGWHQQIPYFAERGYRVVVPDQRGYNLSEKPKAVEAYKINTLARDVVGLADALGYDTFVLVGHDWGAAVAWWVATMFPERLQKLVILNVPYPSIMLKHFRSGNWAQLLKSWYMFFFQIPALPEFLMSLGDFKPFGESLRRTGTPRSFSDADLALYREAWQQPNAITSMVNWYRAMLRTSQNSLKPKPAGSKPFKITVPTLILWGEQDKFLGKELAQPSLDLCEQGELVFFPNATHWLQNDEPEAVNAHIERFLSASSVSAQATR